MPSELSLQATRAAYIGRQLPRLLWYVGHGYIMGRLAEKARERDGQNGRPRARATAPVPDRGRLYRDMASLFRRDLANVEAGVYPLPQDRDGSLLKPPDRSGLVLRGPASSSFLAVRPASTARSSTTNTRGRRPRYYLQNFHFQTGGWMTEDFG